MLPIANAAARSLTQCASNTTRVATKKEIAAHTELLCVGGSNVAADASAPARKA